MHPNADTPKSERADIAWRAWWEAARPHTWPNAIAPVIAGTGAAAYWGSAHLGKALLALGVALALIIGVNYANDYSDGVRGTDNKRTGPTRLTASGIARPEDVKLAAFIAFGVAGVLGFILAATSSWWLILVGALCIAAAWFYTGGPRPYGYAGFGELAVFVFFGLVAVMGTEFVQSGFVSGQGFGCAIAIGCISAAVNLANNIRDIETDEAAGKHTLAVRIGDQSARALFTALTLVPFAATILLAITFTPALLAFAALPFAIAAILTVRRGATGTDLIPVLGMNGWAMLIWAVMTALALSWFGSTFWGQPVPYVGESDFGWSMYIDDQFPGDEFPGDDAVEQSVAPMF
ncbi:1,4-dihydroxy-2-naphthoate polyprenyltransferase [Corynebacterium sp. Q4381]|uniref:1,4-dihydroxy-2-naphthoate polyprenyltransferase n=1 Tax=Corynebacterium sp. Marseille-Q4381 TaxID=3121597 RepID=UPI002FE69335